jgi:hypothetical protein
MYPVRDLKPGSAPDLPLAAHWILNRNGARRSRTIEAIVLHSLNIWGNCSTVVTQIPADPSFSVLRIAQD